MDEEETSICALSAKEFMDSSTLQILERGAELVETSAGYRCTIDGVSATATARGEAALRAWILSEPHRRAQEVAELPRSELDLAVDGVKDLIDMTEGKGVNAFSAILKLLDVAGKSPVDHAAVRDKIFRCSTSCAVRS